MLINELQLGEKLNECIHSERRSDFSLMLAMLVDDVREHAQFSLPADELLDKTFSDEQLRKDFHLPAKQELSVKETDTLARFNQAEQLADPRLTNIHFKNALHPMPLARFDDATRISQEVLSNTSLYCQNRHKNNQPTLSKKLSFNAKAWLDGIQTSIVKSPMVAV